MQPRLPSVLGQQVFIFEAVLQREPLGALAHEEDVVRVLEDELRHLGGRLDPLQGTHRAGAFRGPMHAGGVELHHAVGVGQPAVADRVVVGVELLDLHALDGRIQGVGALHQHVEGLLHRAQPVRAAESVTDRRLSAAH